MTSETGFSKRTAFAIELAKKAGILAKDLQKSEDLHAHTKGLEAFGPTSDIVTIADTETEKLIFSAICDSFPQDGFLGEEGLSKDSMSGYTWVVDPIDGTKNYSRGLPVYGVSIGYMYGGKPHGGVVYMPCTDEMYAAERGKGAFLNSERISVSQKSDPGQASLTIGAPSRKPENIEWLNRSVSRMHTDGLIVYQLHCAVAGMTAVAAGRMEAFINKGFSLWDMCACAVLIEEAGGLLINLDGSPVDYSQVSGHEVLALSAGLDRDDIMRYLLPVP